MHAANTNRDESTGAGAPHGGMTVRAWTMMRPMQHFAHDDDGYLGWLL
jgi:hypothetical protein